MRKKTKLFSTFMAISIAVSSIACSSSSSSDSSTEQIETTSQPIVLTAESSVGGEYGNLFSVVEGDYELSTDGYGKTLNFNMQRGNVKAPLSLKLIGGSKSDSKPYVGKFVVEFLNDNEVSLFDTSISSSDFDKLMSSAPGDKIGINLSVYESEKIDKIKSFRVLFSVSENEDYGDDLEEDLKKASDNIDNAVKALEATGKAAEAVGALGKLLK